MRIGHLRNKVLRRLVRQPRTKQVIKYLLQRAGAALALATPSARIPSKAFTLRDVHRSWTHGAEERSMSFFGYFGRSVDQDGREAYHVLEDSADTSQPISLVVNGVRIAQSNAWNFQQGTQLHWLNDHEIVFNDFNSGLHCRVKNVDTGAERTLGAPVSAVSTDGSIGLGLDYGRINRLRPDYGYDVPIPQAQPHDDWSGLYRLEFSSGDLTTLCTYEQILADLNLPMSLEHEINHPLFAPGGYDFVALIRTYDSGIHIWSRLVLFQDQDGTIRKKTLAADRIISHYSWVDDRRLLVWMFFGSQAGYWLLDAHTAEATPAFGVLGQSDGHPSVDMRRSKIVSDTYPGVFRMQSLFMIETFGAWPPVPLGRFRQPLAFAGVNRCDLHPRWNSAGDGVYLDSAHTGIRRLYELKIPEGGQV